eukprot:m.269082 g.269082  ORF g.269082 m.269082 type:complete len:52 (+) comp15665_c2_seq5:2684-2839(+)
MSKENEERLVGLARQVLKQHSEQWHDVRNIKKEQALCSMTRFRQACQKASS